MAMSEHFRSPRLNVPAIGAAAGRDHAPSPMAEAGLVQHLFMQAPLGVMANVCAGAGVALALWPWVSGRSLLIWGLLLLATAAVRMILVHRYEQDPGLDLGRWRRGFLAAVLSSGLLWGAAVPLFMPASPPPQQLLLVMVLTALCAGGIPTLASVLPVYLSFLAAIVVPASLWFLLHPASPGMVLGLMALVFGVVLASTARNYSTSLTRALLLSEKLHYEATHDALTGLINRREFERRLHELLAPENRDTSTFTLFHLGIDQFKIVNDTCGYTAGDELLRRLTTTLQQVLCPRQGLLARLGGDEFGVLLAHCSADAAEKCAWQLRDVVGAFRFSWEGEHFKLGASIGVVPGECRMECANGALRAADAACRAAKEAGGHRVHVYHPEDQTMLRLSDEMRWATRIAQALDEDHLELYAQPIRALNEPAGTGKRFELLLRLREKSGQLITPTVFLPAVERYGFSVAVDRWTVDRLFRWARLHPTFLRRIDVCSVNLSGPSLSDTEFREELVGRIVGGPFAPAQLCFEITETAAIGDLTNALRFMAEIRRLGCAFALDDFGSGLSSLAYLKLLPVDYLKIDGLFVMGIADDATDRAMVRSISEIGSIMGLRTVAEFVEDERVLATLEEIGIDYAQGYQVGMPVPLGQIFL